MRCGPRFPRPWIFVNRNGTGVQISTEKSYTEYHNCFEISSHIEVEDMLFRDVG